MWGFQVELIHDELGDLTMHACCCNQRVSPWKLFAAMDLFLPVITQASFILARRIRCSNAISSGP